MKLRQLREALQNVQVFGSPKVALEQYPTTPELAAHLLYTAEMSYGDIAGRQVADLGVGCGVLTLGAMLLEAREIWAFDVDKDALSQACENIANLHEGSEDDDREVKCSTCEIDHLFRCFHTTDGATVKCIHLDIIDEQASMRPSQAVPRAKSAGNQTNFPRSQWIPYEAMFDTVIMNPPFGTRLQGADLVFVEAACFMAKTAIYSLHKSSTRSYIESKFSKSKRKDGWTGEVIAELKFNIEASYSFHKKATSDIAVDFWRFSK